MQKKSLKLSEVVGLCMVVALCFMPLSEALGADVTIDDFTVTQGTSAGPPAIQRCAVTANPEPAGGAVSNPDATGLKILGGYRILQVRQVQNVGGAACVTTYCDGGNPPAWAVSNDFNSQANGYIEWNGSTVLGSYALPTLNISSPGYIHLSLASSDLTSSYTVAVYQDAANFCSSTFQAPASPGSPVDVGGAAHPWSGATCTQTVLANVKRITIQFTGGSLDSDSGIRKIWAVTVSPEIACVNPKLFSQTRNATTGELDSPVSSLNLTGKVAAWPATVFAELDVENSGLAQSQVYIEDTLPTGMTYVAGSTKVIAPVGFVLPEPDTSTPGKLKWTSTSNLLAGQTLRFSIQLQQAEFTGTLTNSFHASVPGEPFTDGPCQATLSFQPPPPPGKVPSLNEWGMITLSLILAAAALVLLRRRNSTG